MDNEGPAPGDVGRQLVEAIRAYLESINLPNVEMTVEKDGERIHISGAGWDVWIAKTQFLHITRPDEERDN